MPDCYKTINTTEIDFSDQRYNIFSSVVQDQPFLAESLKETGLIAPPIVRPMGNKYIIISGFNRIRALLFNKTHEITVLIKDKNIEEHECMIIAISDIAFRSALSQAQLIIGISKLSLFFDKSTISKKAPAIFNTSLSEHYIEELLSIGGLPEPAPELINNGNLALKAAKKLCSVEEKAAKIFLDLFSFIKVSLNIQLEIIRNMLEIAAVEGISVQHLYEKMGIRAFFEDENIDRVSIARQIRRVIYERRYPFLSKAQQIAKDKILALNLPDTIKIIPPDNFESRDFTISITISKADELDKSIRILTDPVRTEMLKEILAL